ncbi:MAG: hypothetical protein ABJH00_14360 [Cyclobacteriaceae bacterium]
MASQQEDYEYLYWSDTEKLECKDFQGPIDSARINDQVVAFAASVFGTKYIQIDSSNDLACYKIMSVFKCHKSYMSKCKINLLTHEQFHFNLYELYNRKLKEHLLKKLKCNEEINIIKESELYSLKYDSVTYMYDLETRHGDILIEQKEWEERILQELSDLSNYREVVICIPS